MPPAISPTHRSSRPGRPVVQFVRFVDQVYYRVSASPRPPYTSLRASPRASPRAAPRASRHPLPSLRVVIRGINGGITRVANHERYRRRRRGLCQFGHRAGGGSGGSAGRCGHGRLGVHVLARVVRWPPTVGARRAASSPLLCGVESPLGPFCFFGSSRSSSSARRRRVAVAGPPHLARRK